jgi:hypothetical protein
MGIGRRNESGINVYDYSRSAGEVDVGFDSSHQEVGSGGVETVQTGG